MTLTNLGWLAPKSTYEYVSLTHTRLDICIPVDQVNLFLGVKTMSDKLCKSVYESSSAKMQQFSPSHAVNRNLSSEQFVGLNKKCFSLRFFLACFIFNNPNSFKHNVVFSKKCLLKNATLINIEETPTTLSTIKALSEIKTHHSKADAWQK